MRKLSPGAAVAVAISTLCLAAPLPAAEPIKATPASATSPGTSSNTGARFCAPSDLVGEWSMLRLIPWQRAKVDRRDAWFSDHQRFVFLGNGSMKHVTSTRAFAAPDTALIAASPARTEWAMREDGWLVLTKTSGGPEYALCHVLLAATKDPTGGPVTRGDVVLTYVEGRDPALQKILRRVP
jgi:hypothetical protein